MKTIRIIFALALAFVMLWGCAPSKQQQRTDLLMRTGTYSNPPAEGDTVIATYDVSCSAVYEGNSASTVDMLFGCSAPTPSATISPTCAVPILLQRAMDEFPDLDINALEVRSVKQTGVFSYRNGINKTSVHDYKTNKDVTIYRCANFASYPIQGIVVKTKPTFQSDIEGSMTDSRDNKTYKIVKIGEQTWMAENLNYEAKDSKCYKDKPKNCAKYGRLYNWETAKESCPSGWHLPSGAEWEVLRNNAGGKVYELKAKSGWGWFVSMSGTDKYGFSALPGGYGGSCSFGDVGDGGYWWSSDGINSKNAYYLIRNDDISGSGWGKYTKSSLYSVRCVQD